ncbi:XRE family transcriptional regulator [Paraburkholderia bonniea]|uniref:helix-turn-helix domain-containing protein n=1 Tax=Paraburkholderia bonniea TaxID=2152891 RepID=UPI00129268CB|nr:XRE family transcriptional regulator [Paraburkholderia bonniea]WJF89633.1 XRE family transcriptional regulator [Paraburkholderia bonniea]WJF92947.1 XRE family transcriptional regulator [Paraburkholderia bonniea]
MKNSKIISQKKKPAEADKGELHLNLNLDAATDGVRGIGEDIRGLRKSRRMTINQLASALDRSVGYVSQIERGLSTPTLKDVYAISATLNVTVGWFLRNNEPGLAPADERGLVVRQSNRRRMSQDGILTEALSPQLGEKLEFMQSTFDPGVVTEEKSVQGTGLECGMVLSGQLELWIDDHYFVLNAGDSYSFRRSQRYHSRNPSQTERVVIIWVFAQ